MDRPHGNREMNGVNGSSSRNTVVAAPGQEGYVRQVAPDRYQETVNSSKLLKVATWNVRTLYRAGSMYNVMREMKRLNIDILGLAEVRWPGVGNLERDDVTFVYSGGSTAERGVGIMMTKELYRSIKGFWAISERVILMKFRGKPIDLNIIQAYAPTAEADDETLESFYEQLDRAKKQCKGHEFTVMMGDMNAKVGVGREENVVGPYGLGERNERGNRFVEWCIENKQVITNTWFRHHPRRLWTWKSPGDLFRNQIDFITVNTRFRNAVLQVRTYPGADCNSDHVPVLMKMRIKPKQLERKCKATILCLDVLERNDEIRRNYETTVKNRYGGLTDNTGGLESIEEDWDMLGTAMVETAGELIETKRRVPRRNWMTEDILDLMDERRTYKGIDEVRYRELDVQISRACNEAKEAWMNRECEELEELCNRDPQKMHERIKDLRGKRKRKSGIAIMKADGTVAMEMNEVLDRWREYIAELYEDEREEQDITVIMEGPSIMKAEIEKSVKKMKRGKAAGEDGIMVEMVRALGDWGIEQIVRMANHMHDTGDLPRQMIRSLFVTIPKRAGTLECGKHRTIAISSQVKSQR